MDHLRRIVHLEKVLFRNYWVYYIKMNKKSSIKHNQTVIRNTFVYIYVLWKIHITRPAQFERLISFMQENPDLVRGKGQFHSSKKQQDEQWAQISVELNSIKPPMRTFKEWQMVWIQYKANLKRKLAEDLCGCFEKSLISLNNLTNSSLLNLK